MGKPQYFQKFRKIWLQEKSFKEWLQEYEQDPTKAFCKTCCVTIRAKRFDLVSHGESQKHKSSVSAIKIHQQNSIKFKPISLETNRSEAALSLFVSNHCAILPIDHLGELCNTHFTHNSIKIHRTKCSKIIVNVLAPYFMSNLKEDIGDMYSLLIDESTDIAVHKFLGIAIIYLSKSQKKIITTFLSLEELVECNAMAIVTAIKTCLKKFDLDIKNMVGLGSDNASVMVGINNGVFKMLKEDNPNLILIRCVCHSLQLATSHACAHTIPRHLDFLISETYNWFSKSTLRQHSYKEIYNTINNGHDPLKIVQASNTRWLSVETAVVRIVDQWYELKTHFGISRNKDRCYTAEMLYSIYTDEKNLAYLLFLRPLLGEIQRVNKLFESEHVDSTKLAKDLVSLITSFIKLVVVPTYIYHPVKSLDFTSHLNPKPYLGYGFENQINELKKIKKISEGEEKELRDRCIAFLIDIIKQFQQRLPDNIDISEKIEVLSPSNSLKQIKENISPICEFFGFQNKEIEKIDLQWRNINLLNWKNTNSAVEFRSEVYSFQDSASNNPFKELANLALTALCIPWSNAACERVFSQMNLIKNKLRNKMKSPMLISLLYIRSGLKRNKKCCYNFVLPDSVIKKIGTNDVYNTIETELNETDDDNIISFADFQI